MNRRSHLPNIFFVLSGLLTATLSFGQGCTGFDAAKLSLTSELSAPDSPPSGSSAVDKTQCGYRSLSLSHHRTEIRSVLAPTTCMVVQNASGADGNSIMNYDCSGGTGAPFRPILQADDCSFQIQTLPINATLCLDAGASSDTGLVQHACDTSKSPQRWTLLQNGDASYSFKTRDSRCVEMAGSASEYKQMKISACDGSPAQRFTLSGLAENIVLPQASENNNPTTVPTFADGLTYVRLNPDMVSASAGMSMLGTLPNTTWTHPQEGAFISYPLNVQSSGNYSLQVVYGSWMEDAGTDVYIGDKYAGFMKFPVSSADAADDPNSGGTVQFIETQAFPLKLSAGLNIIKLAAPKSLIPYTIREIYVSYDGQELTKAGFATPISATAKTDIDIAAINRLYRFTLDNSLGVLAWRYPHSVAHLEYKIAVTQAGRYALKIKYSSPTVFESIDVILNGPQVVSAGYSAIANIPLPSTGTGTDIGTFADTQSVVIDLPAGVSRLDFAAHSTPTYDFAVAGISIEPVH